MTPVLLRLHLVAVDFNRFVGKSQTLIMPAPGSAFIPTTMVNFIFAHFHFYKANVDVEQRLVVIPLPPWLPSEKKRK